MAKEKKHKTAGEEKLSRRRKILFAALFALGFLLAAEGGLRILGVNPASSREPSRFYFEQDFNLRHYLHEPDDILFWRLRRGVHVQNQRENLNINALGFRGREIARDKEPGALRIAAMGDSCTFGFGVQKDENTYPSGLESLLREKHPEKRCEVINAGVIGYTTYQALLFLEEAILPLAPDIITFYFGFNDHHFSHEEDRERGQRGGAVRKKSFLEGVRLFVVLRDMLFPRQAPFETMDPKQRVPLDAFEKNCRAFIRTARERKILPVMLTMPLNPGMPFTYNEVRVFVDGEGGRKEKKWVYQNRWIQDAATAALSPDTISRVKAAHIRSGKDRDAHFRYVSLLEDLQKKFPQWPAIPFFLAQEYRILGEKEKALTLFNRALDLDRERRVLREYNRIIRAKAQEANAPLADLASLFTREELTSLFLPGDAIHPNRKGHQKIAETILKVLEEGGLLSEVR